MHTRVESDQLIGFLTGKEQKVYELDYLPGRSNLYNFIKSKFPLPNTKFISWCLSKGKIVRGPNWGQLKHCKLFTLIHKVMLGSEYLHSDSFRDISSHSKEMSLMDSFSCGVDHLGIKPYEIGWLGFFNKFGDLNFGDLVGCAGLKRHLYKHCTNQYRTKIISLAEMYFMFEEFKLNQPQPNWKLLYQKCMEEIELYESLGDKTRWEFKPFVEFLEDSNERREIIRHQQQVQKQQTSKKVKDVLFEVGESKARDLMTDARKGSERAAGLDLPTSHYKTVKKNQNNLGELKMYQEITKDNDSTIIKLKLLIEKSKELLEENKALKAENESLKDTVQVITDQNIEVKKELNDLKNKCNNNLLEDDISTELDNLLLELN